jgi:GntR family transcriptional regulator, transcriptional repressor for pyruvate dehydrogenase complex
VPEQLSDNRVVARPPLRRLTIGQAAPLVALKTYELVAQVILEQVADGRLESGAPVPTEAELAESHGVGRSSVREALRVLESRGVIIRVGHGRFRVAEQANPLAEAMSVMYDLHRIELVDVFDLRALIEEQAAALAATHRTAGDLTKIGEAIGAMQWGSATPDELHRADVRFHIAIGEATGNRATVALIEALRAILYSALHGPLFTRTDSVDFSSATIGEHIQIVEAIKAAEPDAARTAMRKHLDRVTAQSLAVLSRVASESASAPMASSVHAREPTIASSAT